MKKYRKNISLSIYKKYGKSRWGLSYREIGEEFKTTDRHAWWALNKFRNVGSGYNLKFRTPEEIRINGALGNKALREKGLSHKWDSEEGKKARAKRKVQAVPER